MTAPIEEAFPLHTLYSTLCAESEEEISSRASPALGQPGSDSPLGCHSLPGQVRLPPTWSIHVNMKKPQLELRSWSDCPKSPRIRYIPVEHEGFTYPSTHHTYSCSVKEKPLRKRVPSKKGKRPLCCGAFSCVPREHLTVDDGCSTMDQTLSSTQKGTDV